MAYSPPRTIPPPNLSSSLTLNGYVSFLDACNCPQLGKQAHALIAKSGCFSSVLLKTKMLQTYSRCGCLEESLRLFEEMDRPSIHAWCSVINMFVDQGFPDYAQELFNSLLESMENTEFDSVIFPALFKISCAFGDKQYGRQLHGFCLKLGFGVGDTYVCNSLINMYGEFGNLEEAESVLQSMLNRDTISWNSLINSFAKKGMLTEAVALVHQMETIDQISPNLVTMNTVIASLGRFGDDESALEFFQHMISKQMHLDPPALNNILPSIARLRDIKLGKLIHGYALKRGYHLNGLIDVYRRCGAMISAEKVFTKMNTKKVSMINMLISGYFESGNVSAARRVFDGTVKHRDLVSWNSMISGYVNHSMFNEALHIFCDLLAHEKLKVSSFSLASALAASGDSKKLKELHLQAIVRGFHTNAFVGTALAQMYSQSLNFRSADIAFAQIDQKDLPAWNNYISSFGRRGSIAKLLEELKNMEEEGCSPDTTTWNGAIASAVNAWHIVEAYEIFRSMQISVKPNAYTVSIALHACSITGTLSRGKEIHGYAVRNGHVTDSHVSAALVDTYAKCGAVADAARVFERTPSPCLVLYNAMVAAYAWHGDGKRGVATFESILKSNLKPDGATFVSALSSCAHLGRVELGFEIFGKMGELGIAANAKHYTCMVDMMSRAGRVKEACGWAVKVGGDEVTWRAVIGGCVRWGEYEMGEKVAGRIGGVGRWEDYGMLRKNMKQAAEKKVPGCSWIEEGGSIHCFLAYDDAHASKHPIYHVLRTLYLHIQQP